jgi:hypothetical protein
MNRSVDKVSIKPLGRCPRSAYYGRRNREILAMAKIQIGDVDIDVDRVAGKDAIKLRIDGPVNEESQIRSVVFLEMTKVQSATLGYIFSLLGK